MRATWRLTAAGLALAALAAWTAGCGGDDDEEDRRVRIDVRPGLWTITENSTSTGKTVICQLSVSDTSQQSFCGDVESLLDTGLPVDCSITVDGNELDIACEGEFEELGCTFNTTTSGSGTFDETSFEVNASSRVVITGAPVCRDTCEVTTRVTGRWVSSGGCNDVPEAPVAGWPPN
jgi:hypothetical protein